VRRRLQLNGWEGQEFVNLLSCHEDFSIVLEPRMGKQLT
jgi:hypothetical protein